MNIAALIIVKTKQNKEPHNNPNGKWINNNAISLYQGMLSAIKTNGIFIHAAVRTNF